MTVIKVSCCDIFEEKACGFTEPIKVKGRLHIPKKYALYASGYFIDQTGPQGQLREKINILKTSLFSGFLRAPDNV